MGRSIWCGVAMPSYDVPFRTGELLVVLETYPSAAWRTEHPVGSLLEAGQVGILLIDREWTVVHERRPRGGFCRCTVGRFRLATEDEEAAWRLGG